MTETSRILAGGMSGTSADGVDVAIVRVDGRGYEMTARLVQHHHRPYNEKLRGRIFAFRGGGAGAGGAGAGGGARSVSQDTLRELAEIAREISLTYAAAVSEALAAARMNAKNLSAVAAHGQTLFHDPPNTIQLLDPSLLAAEVDCAVVSDFRRADLAAGGQGAPLVPFADYILFRDPGRNRVLLNLGGIANFSWLAARGTPSDIIAFDTGPANCIIDHLMHGGIDTNGQLAARGKVSEPLLADVLEADYFDRPPPRSTDGPEMIDLFRAAQRRHPEVTEQSDLLATACAVTAESIVRAMRRWCPAHVDEVIASGGGTKNATLMNMLRDRLGGEMPLRTTDELGVSSDAKEAVAFALLAAATLDGVPSNVPSVTGATRPVVLGSITPRA